MKARLFKGIVLVASLFLFSACEEQTISRSEDGILFLGSYEASDVVERVIAPGDRSLVLEGFAGSIKVVGDDSDVARLRITRHARGDTPAEAEARLANLEIEETGDAESFRYNFSSSEEAMSRYDVEGTVPVKTPIKIHWVAGDIEVGGLAGDVEAANRHGDVSYSGPALSVHLRTRNGGVSAILAAAGPASDVDLVTNNGDVSVSVSPQASVRVEASTSAGSIGTGSLAFVSETYYPMDAGAKFEGRIAEGTGRIMIMTEHGSVALSEYVPEIPVTAETSDVDAMDGSESASPDTVIASTEDVPAVHTPADSLK